MCENQKIELKLSQDKKKEIVIISKAFRMTPNKFIEIVLIKEIDYIKSQLDSAFPKEELEDYNNSEVPIIDVKELKKLILLEGDNPNGYR
ncbi:hypothetical protein LCGC14_0506460 [marine sediment metagenome]|uniref:DUF1778 domain-containing protein n=1 Tax=marine sediment metagenome TaxID=412755 RepID=A0A0F9UP68_9ZZZZ